MKIDEILWNNIKRFDSYYATTNTKGSFILAFNTIIFSCLIFKWDDIVKLYNNQIIIVVINFILLAISLLALVSSFFMLKVVVPYLKSIKRVGQYQSILFFEHIGEFSTEQDYLDTISKIKENDITKDLAYQTYSLAKGLKKKFQFSKIAFGIIIYGELPLMAIAIILKIINLFLIQAGQS
jgi:hypothetical protein